MSQDKIESRRAFMKKFGKLAGAAAVAAAFMVTGSNNAEAKPSEDNPPSTCYYSCEGSCFTDCKEFCEWTCKGPCRSACTGSCETACFSDCYSTCRRMLM